MNTSKRDSSLWAAKHHYFTDSFMQMLNRLVIRIGNIIDFLNYYQGDKLGKHRRIQAILLDTIDALHEVIAEGTTHE